jgi:hypothetical protein
MNQALGLESIVVPNYSFAVTKILKSKQKADNHSYKTSMASLAV